MNITPFSCAFLMAGTMALESLGVIRMVLAPAAIMFSMAVTWPALSPSALPAALSSLAPRVVASFCAPSFIFTKKGLVSVLVMRPITGCCATANVLAATHRLPIRVEAIRKVAVFDMGHLLEFEVGRRRMPLACQREANSGRAD